ncbi:hypothetical protein KQI82_06215 [Oscillibacter sp. MSJ-2]|uniref:Uncharacterized protein n=1 Tax=Dysosmobacter acutus TaxID=2841504 RepID=A0ABS6F899_9FIRM|nr:hypothetical protein [Dysosmobacter acutus]MBU5626513.1 hypothetical protein [Dysosmobacter acutus]
MITETVLISAITACAGLGGAAIGAYASIRIAREQSRAQLSRCVLEGTYNARRASYQKVFDAETAFTASRTAETATSLLRAVKEACVVASPNAAARMMLLTEAATSGSYLDFDAVRADMLIVMQRDLATFTAPKIEQYGWSDSTSKPDGKDKGENAGQPE